MRLSVFFFFSSRRRHTRFKCDWSSDVCSSDLHYGRWIYIGTAWGWIPPPLVVVPVYVPALVAFLGGPHFSVGIGIGAGLVGGFPPGPREPFFSLVPLQRYLSEYRQGN